MQGNLLMLRPEVKVTMSSGFHVGTGTAVALGTHKFLGIATWSEAFWIWMCLLIVASNAADKDGIWWRSLDRWVAKPSKSRRERGLKEWCAKWLAHRRFCHSFLAMLLDLWWLVSVTRVLQLNGNLPSFDPTLWILLCLAIHLAVDTVDGSEGIQFFAPFFSRMIKFPALCMDLEWHHRNDPCPVIRRGFRRKVRCEAGLALSLNFAGFLVALRL